MPKHAGALAASVSRLLVLVGEQSRFRVLLRLDQHSGLLLRSEKCRLTQILAAVPDGLPGFAEQHSGRSLRFGL
jgi:hypothetical protein